jgi:hypothetical protein
MLRSPRRVALLSLLALGACGRVPEPHPPTVEPVPSAEPAAPSPAAVPPSSAAPAVAAPAAEPPLPGVEFVQVEPASPPGKLPSIAVVAPGKGQVIPAAQAKDFAVKLRVSGWELERGGKHLCVLVDRHPCRRVADAAAPIALGDLDPTVPTLDAGQHVLTVFARRGSNESVKPAGKTAAFASVSFFVGKRTPPAWKEGGPMLFLNVPDEGPAPPEGILLDAYVANADFGTGTFRVHATIGGPGIESGRGESVASLKPWRLKNPRPGEYTARFSLFRFAPTRLESGSATEVSYESRPVEGPFGEMTRTFRVTAPQK